MPSRRKLIEQVIGKYAFNGEALSAGSTSAHVSSVLDRRGYSSMYLFAEHFGATGQLTSQTTTIVVYDDNSSAGLTVSAYNTAAYSITLNAVSGTSTGALFVDLAGAERYLKIYATSSGALSNTVTLSIAPILGDAVTEPAI
jgi:hypothetical protein